jgi:hypothetical protein
MNDLVTVAETMVRDPIVGAFALMGVSVLVTRLLFKQHPIGRAVSRLVFFILITLLLLQVELFPINRSIRTARISVMPSRDC